MSDGDTDDILTLTGSVDGQILRKRETKPSFLPGLTDLLVILLPVLMVVVLSLLLLLLCYSRWKRSRPHRPLCGGRKVPGDQPQYGPLYQDNDFPFIDEVALEKLPRELRDSGLSLGSR